MAGGILVAVSENVKPVERHYEAFNRGDRDGLLEPFDPEIVFVEEPDVRPDAGTHTGIDQVRAFFAAMFEGSAEIAAEPLEWIEQDDKVIVPMRLYGRFRHTGIEGEARFVHVWTVRDGRITHLHLYTDKEQALAAVGLPSPRG
jgi:ketosteroid isomerase-like protein